MHSHGKDIKGSTLAEFADVAQSTITAGGGGDGAELTGDSIDLEGLDARPASVCFEIPCNATLASDETLTVVGHVQKSADNSSWSDMTESETVLTMTATGKAIARIGADLIESDCRYIRYQATPTLSASGTDTVDIGDVVAVFGGLDQAPVS